MKRLLLSATFLVLLVGLSFAQVGTNQMYVKVNGNSYPIYNLFADSLQNYFRANTEIFKSMVHDTIISYVVSQGYSPYDYRYPNPAWPTVIKSINCTPASDGIWINFTVDSLRIHWNIAPGIIFVICKLEGSADDALGSVMVSAKVKLLSNGTKYSLYVDSINTDASNFVFKHSANWLNNNLFIGSGMDNTVNGMIQKKAKSFLGSFNMDLFDLAGYKFGNTILSAQTAQEVLNAFPAALSLGASTDNNLVFNVNFMQDGSEPPPVTSPSYDYIGFACPYYAFQTLKSLPGTGITTVLQQEKMLIDSMASFNAQAIRFSIPWKEIAPGMNINVSSSHTPDELNDSTVLNTAVNSIPSAVWANTDTIISMAFNRRLDVIPQLLQQELDLPRVGINSAILAPDAVLNGSEIYDISKGQYYRYINPDLYLYYVKIFANAAVRRYKDKIGIWALECELNCARIAAEPDVKWRHGSAWLDESIGGFQDKYWKILVDAVRKNDPTAKITMPFHMLNLASGINRFGSDVDIIGVNIYPDLNSTAYPVMGFMVGELVRATRKFLYNKGWSNKQIHVTETSYPGKDHDATSYDGASVNECIQKYSFYRQKKFMEDAITSSVNFGATGFFWWGFLDCELDKAPEGGQSNYGSLISLGTSSISFKPAATSFQTKVPTCHPLKASVIFQNVGLSGGQDLGGKISLYSERDNLNSGSFVPAIRNRYHYEKTEQQYLQGLKHNRWNASTSNYKMNNQFYVEPTIATKTETARFTSSDSATVGSLLIENTGISNISAGFNDPWWVDASGNQPGTAFNPSTKLNRVSVFLNQTTNLGTYYSVSVSPTQNISGYNSIFLGWTASGAILDTTKDSTSVVFTTSNANVTAKYKGTHLSNNASTFSNNSQRKIVRTGNGWLHMVYESGGHVWYEMSTDNGSTWSLMSPVDTTIGGVRQLGTPGPLDSAGIGGKCPSIDYSHNPIDSTSIVIVFEQKYGTSYSIRQIPYLFCKSDTCPCNNGPWITENTYAIVYGADPYATTNANPTITWGADGSGLLTWETKSNTPGIYYLVGTLNGRSSSGFNPGFQTSMYPTILSGTSINSTNATTSGIYFLSSNSMFYDIAWEHDYTSTKSSIKHLYLRLNSNGLPTPSAIDTISSKSISKNYKPSLIENDSCVICSWIGDLDGSGTWMNVYAYERQVGYSTIYRYGVGAQSVSMNKDNGTNYYLAWVQNSSYSQNPSSCTNSVVGSNLSAQNLNTTGQNIQLCNGPTSSKMYVSSFYNSALPYYFQTSNSLTSAPHGDILSQANAVSKKNAVSTTNALLSGSGRGRGIAIDKGNTGFYYSIGDINVDGNLIDFVSTNKKTKYYNMDTLNNMLLSQPFLIKSNSVLSFSENSGAADTVAAAGILGANGYISFTVQVIDNASGSVLGTIKKVKFSSSNLQLKYKTSPFTLPTTGLGGKTGRLKIIVGTNLDSLRLALVEQYAGPGVSVMGQASNLAMQTTSASGITLGSYPNPFNPSTNISYQLIENSRISIKVYDILGRQITTLVDGNKTAGQYIAVFDGSHFASGVYFVRMMVQGSNAQQIVKTLKIQMLK